MEVRASLQHVRIAPRKIRLIIDTVRGISVEDAMVRMTLLNKRAVDPLKKLLASAIANAEHNFELKKSNLYIKEIFANEGSMLKRWMPRAHGRATQLLKRSSHVTIVLDERVPTQKAVAKKKTTLQAPVTVSEKPRVKETVEEEEDKEEKTEGERTAKPRSKGAQKTKSTGHSSNRGGLRRLFQRKSG